MRVPAAAVLLSVATVAVLCSGGVALAQTLDALAERGSIRIGFREDAAPFSYRSEAGEPAGFTIDLCQAVTDRLRQTERLTELSIDYIPVTAENRFDAVAEDEIDLLCGAATETLERRELVDFSLPVFVDGASLAYRADGPTRFEDLAGHSVAVRAGTTTEQLLREALAASDVEATLVTVGDHADGLEQLQAGDITAYFADRSILIHQFQAAGEPDTLKVSSSFLTVEPYALALPLGDTEFRLAVDRALSDIYRSGEIGGIYQKSFGSVPPSPELRTLFLIAALPE